ncbi:MAG: hypothetical protein KatS3mg129_3192 [Leptospiraceae bacterium]|nr:MAG: hypothetical protein KatS3mg129_0430 [Leptospiraceae bacterium]GIX43459.1 MAG: hypothetical protein KatS3mg129_3192 [Leptospiraceae bacterium]
MNSKSEYIFVRSINDVDPKKLTIRDLNKKFIDEDGRKYALKFDFQTRQIKFVRLASSYQEALKIKQEILREKHKKELNQQKLEDNIQNIYAKQEREIIDLENKQENQKNQLNQFSRNVEIDFLSPDESLFDENEFLKELERDTKKSVESLRAIEKNLNRAQVFEKLSTSLNEFFDLQKEIEIKCYNASEEAIKMLKELVYYPRPATHYLSRLPDPIRKRIENLDSKQQLDYIRRYEIYKIFRELIMNIIDFTNKLERIYYKLPAIDRERKPLVDLLPSFAEIKETTENLIQKMNTWYSNYQKL